ncbi:aminotransferase class I/II-fold pyridoxal phosphate-dependent enzyme [Deferrisoma camini]|uniref:aminotransferase class I/II-fold pyridoxal phosphate-dependent enzyme n=1 Tax=Deferrisoma camini TaxID=1035120 RepID=UPI00046D7C8A|nr:aminotransferase class I/II-fold pyridoxal phosphate-dependent enzyme [Deferrisoma camini]
MWVDESVFHRIQRLPPYVFKVVDDLKMEARRRGEDIIDLGMGNPDRPTPAHIVDKLVEAAQKPKNHRYSVSRGIYKLRLAMAKWYERRYGVALDPESEVCVTLGAKEGLAHLVMAILGSGDVAFVPNPTYPIHSYSVVLADGDLRAIELGEGGDEFLGRLEREMKTVWPRPKLLILNFPQNPTTQIADLGFFEKVVGFCRENRILLIHDLAYADICFNGYRAPSILEVPGAKDLAVEFVSLSKSYNMAGWRVGFCVGNPAMIHALTRIKSYLDYGMFQPVQIASVIALETPDEVVQEIAEVYRVRRDKLVEGLGRAGWPVEKPKATMFVWAPIPEPFRGMGSLEFAKLLLREAKVAVSPGIGFGQFGDDHVRFALVENEHRIHQAVAGIRGMMRRLA